MATIAASDLSFSGLSVHPLTKGKIRKLTLLDKALALELAAFPVARIVVGGAVVITGTGVSKAPPKMTGTSCVVPETTVMIVEITGC